MVSRLEFQPAFKLAQSTFQVHSPVLAAGLPAARQDTVKLARPGGNIIRFGQQGNVTKVATLGALANPLDADKPALQMKVTGVTNYQKSLSDPKFEPKSVTINELADSDWKDGQRLVARLAQKGNFAQIALSLPANCGLASGGGDIGRVPDEIAKIIMPVFKANPRAFQFELSNVIAGMTRGAETIGLRVNVLYKGKGGEAEVKVREAFNEVLNSKDCRDKVLLYQPETSPTQVLERILQHETHTHGTEAARKMEGVIQNIVTQLQDPENKRILLLGHCKPDGDTLGCVIGLKNAIHLMNPDKHVDTAVDDKIPGLFRHKLPGVDDVKRPHDPDKITEITAHLAELQGKAGVPDKDTQHQIDALKDELVYLKDEAHLLKPNDKYDLVVLLDIPTPKRFTDRFKQYLDTAKSVIYIDHHPHRLNEWQDAAAKNGVDMDKAHAKGVAWIADAVAAAAQLVAIIGSKIPGLKDLSDGKPPDEVFKTQEQKDQFAAYVAGLATGTSTDTGSFNRTANLKPQDMSLAVQERPNFHPEGLMKWLMALTGGTISKKWLRENIVCELPDAGPEGQKRLDETAHASAYEQMLEDALAGKTVYPDLSLGIVQVNYDQMSEVWRAAREVDPEFNLGDIQTSFKLNEVMGVLRTDPALTNRARKKESGQPTYTLAARSREDYKGTFDTNRIAVLVCQDKKQGELDEKLEKADQNGLRLSFRSGEGTNHAELLANMFGGGGHGAASGGRVDLPGVEVGSKLAVTLNGKIERDPKVILAALTRNYEINNDDKTTFEWKQANKIPVQVVFANDGKTCKQIISDVTKEIRATQETDEEQRPTSKKKGNGNKGQQQANPWAGKKAGGGKQGKKKNRPNRVA